jgi:hypothetical protein
MPAANSITVKALDIVNAAAFEIGALAGGEQLSSDDQAWVLQKLQRLIDRYNAREVMVYNVNFTVFTLNPPINPLDPTTIGPGGNFDVNQRPVSIESIGLILDSDTSHRCLLLSRLAAWLNLLLAGSNGIASGQGANTAHSG